MEVDVQSDNLEEDGIPEVVVEEDNIMDIIHLPQEVVVTYTDITVMEEEAVSAPQSSDDVINDGVEEDTAVTVAEPPGHVVEMSSGRKLLSSLQSSLRE